MKVCILSGSARKNNNTLCVSKALSKQFSESVIVDYQEYDLPNFNQGGVPKNNQTEFQAKLIDSIEKSDLIFVVTPEYNWFPTAEIINTIHQLAQNDYAHIFDQKVIATVGVSASNTFEVQEVTKCIDSDGVLLDNERFNKGFLSFVDYSLKVAERWHSNR